MSTTPSAVQLHDYQEVAKNFLVNQSHAAIFLEMGFGKSLVTLETLNTVQPQGHILVVAPLNIVRSTWIDEIEKWGFNVRNKSLIVNENGKKLSKEKRLQRYAETLRDSPTMYFVNQDLIEDLVDNMATRFDERMVEALLQMISTRTSPELDQKLRDKLGGRDDKSVVTDIISFLKQQVVDARSAIEEYAAGSSDPKRATRLHRKAQRLLALAEGIEDSLISDVEAFPAKWSQSTGNKLRPVLWPFSTVIIDESQGFKNPSSGRFKALKLVRPAITRMVQMTGTPTPNGLLDLWAQVYLLDEGKSLGKTLSEYKRRWFYESMHINNRPVAWEPRAGAQEEIYDAVKHLVMSVENTSLQLPPVTINDVYVHLDPDEMKAYRDFQKESVLDLATVDGSTVSITAVNAAVLAARLTQFASGTIYTPPSVCIDCRTKIIRTVAIDDDEQPIVLLNHEDPDLDDQHLPRPVGQHDSWETVHSRKIEHLDYILRNTSSPVIVAYRFVSDRKRLIRDLAALGHDVHLFDGSRNMIKDWNDKKYPVMLLQPASAGHGLNLQQGGHTMVWYTLPVSLEHYLQTNARLHRQGQTQPVMIHRLLTKGTYDERLPKMLSNKKITQDDLIEAVMIDVASLDPDDFWIRSNDYDPDDDVGFDTSELI